MYLYWAMRFKGHSGMKDALSYLKTKAKQNKNSESSVNLVSAAGKIWPKEATHTDHCQPGRNDCRRHIQAPLPDPVPRLQATLMLEQHGSSKSGTHILICNCLSDLNLQRSHFSPTMRLILLSFFGWRQIFIFKSKEDNGHEHRLILFWQL